MTWWKLERLEIADTNKSTIDEQRQFLTLWNCVCGTCIVCQACLDILEEEEE